MTELRWAVVGTGAISTQIVDDLALVRGAAIAAVVSRDAGRARQFAQKHHIEHAGDLSQILQRDDIDVVYVATPYATHHSLARTALLAGKHVVVEKPATLNAAEMADLIQLAQATGAFLIEAMWMKFNPAYRELRRLLADGLIGEVRSVRASFGIPFPRDESSRWNAELHGSALLDQGIYPITLARDVLGTPDGIHASGTRAHGLDLSQHATFDYQDGRFAQLASSMTEFVDPTAAISGTRGWVSIPFPFWAGTRFTAHVPQGEDFMATQEFCAPREGHGYVPMLREINIAILQGHQEHPWHRWQDTIDIFVLMENIQQQYSLSGAPG
ncbi:Gfo/Idh/MocA family protein [Arthrobacter sedimenti]|uniref:Gfo/Idh/MocA family protein n=1 Tax=Arthrobacter sedimenti TaxID=2694931 RepID=UPI000B35D933|nr:Gfo/Idh/MocA family oxidoreductase [Arthrobacter sedimenti]OUM41707.1 hypothetical protein B8W73_08605 [Arthrobacter agilis]